MNTNSLDWLISVDDHVIEPPHTWQSRLPARYLEVGPSIVTDDDGGEAWHFEDKRVPTMNLSVVASEKDPNYKPTPVRFDEMRPGCYDPVARVADMDRDGVIASLPFPSFPRFCGQTFHEARDRDLGLLCVQAYNDFITEEWAGAAPGRFIPLIIIPLWDPRLAAVEIERCAGKGARSVAFSENPTLLGLPSIHDKARYWDPVFRACEETRMPLCAHLGSSSQLFTTSADAPTGVSFVLASLTLMSACVDWLFADNFVRFPGLKLCLSEGGISWIPAALERCEQVIEEQGSWVRNPDWPSPTQMFRDHIYGCTLKDEIGISLLDEIGVENVMWETDYPHGASPWPDSIKLAHRLLQPCTNEQKWLILQGNARRVFDFEPAKAPART